MIFKRKSTTLNSFKYCYVSLTIQLTCRHKITPEELTCHLNQSYKFYKYADVALDFSVHCMYKMISVVFKLC